MASALISDDSDSSDQSFTLNCHQGKTAAILISDDESSDDNAMPKVVLSSMKSAAVRSLFPKEIKRESTFKELAPKGPVFEEMIGGVKVLLPVKPYGCQLAIMFKVITAIKQGKNCLLESPTGSGKTLALLCGALAWQQHEYNRLGQTEAQGLVSKHPELQDVAGVVDYIATPKKDGDTPEKLFSKPTFGEKTIYYKPGSESSDCLAAKRQESLGNDTQNSTSEGLVQIHKKRRLNNGELYTPDSTPKKPSKTEQEQTSPMSVPTVFYGARTHKQLEQVIKEFKRTAYCGLAKMTVLSSRDYSCIRDFDRSQWASKNDMCRGCIKPNKNKNESNCEFYDNRAAMHHGNLPPAFDLEELVATGHSRGSCPYFAAKSMASGAHIIFCPYNYLIDPIIRRSMQIDLNNNILIIDEAHNIENICRDSATFSFTRQQIQDALKELEIVQQYRYSITREDQDYVGNLIKTLKSWDYWFQNQRPLLSQQAVNNNEVTYEWDVGHFAQTLTNHNIGYEHYNEFKLNSSRFCQRLRDEPRSLLGATQATGTLLESLDTALGYLFREECKHMDDFKPAIVLRGSHNAWRKSQFDKSVWCEALRLVCLHGGAVWAALGGARCRLLASGTLAPLTSLPSELAAPFPLRVSPNHVVDADRVWVGSLRSCAGGAPLQLGRAGAARAGARDGLGAALRLACRVTPHGVLAFLPSYTLLAALTERWTETGLWDELKSLKHVFQEQRNVQDHNETMEEYYKCSASQKGALLLAVYRGKVAEGMDFRDHQARAVLAVGIPYPNTFELAVREKLKYNDKYTEAKSLLSGKEWLRVQAYRALNQAVGRCVRHKRDWGAVLLIDERFASSDYYREHLPTWLKNFLGHNHHTYESLESGPNCLEAFMNKMKAKDAEEDAN